MYKLKKPSLSLSRHRKSLLFQVMTIILWVYRIKYHSNYKYASISWFLCMHLCKLEACRICSDIHFPYIIKCTRNILQPWTSMELLGHEHMTTRSWRYWTWPVFFYAMLFDQTQQNCKRTWIPCIFNLANAFYCTI